MDTALCPHCGEDVPFAGFRSIGEEIECPSCKKKSTVEYDESWDGEEENYWFWLSTKE